MPALPYLRFPFYPESYIHVHQKWVEDVTQYHYASYGKTSMTKLWVDLPTVSVPEETIFSMPHLRDSPSRRRRSRSSVTPTITSDFPTVSGVPESCPVALSITSHAGPRSM